MDPTDTPPDTPRNVAKQQYAVLRRSLSAFDERVVGRYWGEDTPVRANFERLLGSIDRLAGWLLDDNEISERGEALMRGSRSPAGREQGQYTVTVVQEEQASRQELPAAPDEATVVDEAAAVDEAAVVDDAVEEGLAGESVAPGQPVARASTVDVTFTLPAEVHADSAVLCGDFNNWSTSDTQLARGSDGSWAVTIALEPGHSYRYRYLVDGGRWENGQQADRYVPNPFGSLDSVIDVK